MKKHYKVTLKTLSPLFIGSGETLRKSQYIYIDSDLTANIIDERELTKWLIKNNKLDTFIDIVAKDKNASLQRILKDIGFNDLKKITKYSLKVNRLANKDSRAMNDLVLFVRDGAGDVYIPGSSLKGALRTCLLKTIGDEKSDRARELFSNISISDSDTLSNTNLAIYQKIDFSKQASGKIPLYRECIKSGQVASFILTLEDEYNCIDDIMDSIQSTYSAYHEKWAFPLITSRNEELKKYHFFDNYDTSEESLGKDRCLIYLGGGPGFVSKTLHYKEKERETAKRDIKEILTKKFPVYRKLNSMPGHVPMALKLAIEDNKLMEIGKCELFFDEIL